MSEHTEDLMNTDTTRLDDLSGSYGHPASRGSAADEALAHERAVDAILDDCFLSIGQAIGLRATFEYDAVVWVRNNFRTKFLAAMAQFGNRWLEDRATVTAVCGMLGERAVRHANGACSIGLDAAMQASADVERYCQVHAARRSGARGSAASDAATALIAGYWCTWDEP
jgi:hypothetical protein